MTDKVMHCVCLAATGHVLAAVAATSGTEALKLEALTGDVFTVVARRASTQNTHGIRPMASPIPAALLELKTAPLDPLVIADPLAYAMDGGAPFRLPDALPPPNAPPLTASVITLAGLVPGTTGLAVVSEEHNPAGERRIQSGTFPADAMGNVAPLTLTLSLMPPAEVPAGLTAGDSYDIMTAIAGVRLFWDADTA